MSKEMPHPGHDQHLCHLVEEGLLKNKPEEFEPLIRDGAYYCAGCGRVAAGGDSLCAPKKL